MQLSKKGQQLVELYSSMATNGYATADQQYVEQAFNDMEVQAFRQPVRELLRSHNIRTLLDYGCGGSNYEITGFDGQLTALQYFGLEQVFRYEPARNIDERQQADAVLCFDVLEHVFISDVPSVVRELYRLADRLLVVNVACYSARALLPNGENAHITVRAPLWWKGLFDAISLEFPHVSTCLYCSVGWRNVQSFNVWSAAQWQQSPTFVVND